MEQEHRDRLKHLWEAGIKSAQKLIKMTGLGRSTIYKNIKKLKEGDDLKRTLGSGRKHILKGNDRRRFSQIAVKNPLFSSGQVAERAEVKGSPKVSR
jgi:transposase